MDHSIGKRIFVRKYDGCPYVTELRIWHQYVHWIKYAGFILANMVLLLNQNSDSSFIVDIIKRTAL